MINFDLAPKTGRILAYAYDQLVYDDYQLQGDKIVLRSGKALDLKKVYELHLFDTKAEFRALLQEGEFNVRILSAQEEKKEDIDHFVFSETQFVQERFWIEGKNEKIVVNNRFSFDQDGFLRLVDYRLAMEETA